MKLSELSPEQKRALILKACGWTRLGGADYHERGWDTWANGNRQLDAARLPNYLTSLDAMHEAERTLSYEQRQRMVAKLQSNFGAGYYTDSHFCSASQRADAFLLALNLVES